MKNIFTILAVFAFSFCAHAQTFEIRAVAAGGPNIGIEMRETSGTPPTTSNFLLDLVFGVKWLSALGPNLDISITSTGYNMVNGAPDAQTEGAFLFRSFGANSTPFNFPVDWVVNEWVEIAVLTSNELGTEPTGTFEITEAGFNATADANINVDGVDYSPSINGSAANVATGSGAAPVELASFRVSKFEEENARVAWQTASEQNTSHFEIERSLDEGANWKMVGVVGASGFSTDIKHYSFEDKNLKRFIDKNQLIYYRLKSVDLDQTHMYSQTRNIEVTLETISIAVYPNPTVDGVQVTVHSKDQAHKLTAIVKDIKGRTLLSQQLGKATMINQYVSFDDLAAGTYFLTVQSEGRVFATERLIVLEK